MKNKNKTWLTIKFWKYFNAIFRSQCPRGDDIHCIVVAIRYLLFICFLLHRIKISWYKKVWEEQVYIKKKLRFEFFVLFCFFKSFRFTKSIIRNFLFSWLRRGCTQLLASIMYVFYMYILGRNNFVIIIVGKSFLQQGTSFLVSQFVVVKWLCITNILVANKTKICSIVKETINSWFQSLLLFIFSIFFCFVQKLP